jgi:hypothetical protein
MRAAVAHCRGCGCMTAHEQAIKGSDVPFCRRCALEQLLQQPIEATAAGTTSSNRTALPEAVGQLGLA